jgi:small subunit ribosomal protein S6
MSSIASKSTNETTHNAMKKYEAMIVLDTKGKQESAEQLASTIEKEFIKAGAKVEQIDHLGLKRFPTAPRHVEAGWFVNYFFQAEPTVIDVLRNKLKLNENIYQQYYQVQA